MANTASQAHGRISTEKEIETDEEQWETKAGGELGVVAGVGVVPLDAEVNIILFHEVEKVWVGDDLELANASSFGFEDGFAAVVADLNSDDLLLFDSIDEIRIADVSSDGALLIYNGRCLSWSHKFLSHCRSSWVSEKGEGKSKGGERALHVLEEGIGHDFGESSMDIFHDLFWLILYRNVHEILKCLFSILQIVLNIESIERLGDLLLFVLGGPILVHVFAHLKLLKLTLELILESAELSFGILKFTISMGVHNVGELHLLLLWRLWSGDLCVFEVCRLWSLDQILELCLIVEEIRWLGSIFDLIEGIWLNLCMN